MWTLQLRAGEELASGSARAAAASPHLQGGVWLLMLIFSCCGGPETCRVGRASEPHHRLFAGSGGARCARPTLQVL